MSAPVESASWRKYICRACGLIYDEEEGDADSGLAPGTRFDDIPDDWSCPLCGVTKADFEPYVAVVLPPATGDLRHVSAGKRRADRGVVIVGAGCAGWQMVQALREQDAAVPITMVTACDGDVYDKPLLSVAMAKELSLAGMVKETARQAAARFDVHLMTQTHAVSIATGASSLRTTRGTLRYRHLVLAHGAAPRAMAPLPEALCWRINDLQTYAAFRQRIDQSSSAIPQRIVIVGAGLVGSELANDLAIAGYRVTLLDMHVRPLHEVLDARQSQQLLSSWEKLPLQFVGGVRVAHVKAIGAVRQVLTEDGQIFVAEHVISATGLQTPSQLARTAGLAWNDGIAVDARTLRTSVPNIHALGDCISIDGTSHRFIEPIGRQARVIAANLVGKTCAHYESRRPVVRVKTGSLGFTVSG